MLLNKAERDKMEMMKTIKNTVPVNYDLSL